MMQSGGMYLCHGIIRISAVTATAGTLLSLSEAWYNMYTARYRRNAPAFTYDKEQRN